jgi:hypothetical protein
MKLTERQLRNLVRETLIKEQPGAILPLQNQTSDAEEGVFDKKDSKPGFIGRMFGEGIKDEGNLLLEVDHWNKLAGTQE